MKVPGISVPTAGGSVSLTGEVSGKKTMIRLSVEEHETAKVALITPEDAHSLGKDLLRLASLGGEPNESTATGNTSAFVPAV